MLGVLLIVGCFGYLAGVLTDFLALDVDEGVAKPFAAIGGLPELAFVAWLLVKGVRLPAGGAPVTAIARQLQP